MIDNVTDVLTALGTDDPTTVYVYKPVHGGASIAAAQAAADASKDAYTADNGHRAEGITLGCKIALIAAGAKEATIADREHLRCHPFNKSHSTTS